MSKQVDEISYATNKKHTIKFKIVFIGDQAVGKSSIINRFIKNQFDMTHNPTVGIDFVSKNIVINQKCIRLQLWDTAGQQRFRSLIPGYLRDSNAIFLVYDITNEDSYNNVDMWLDYIKENRGQDVCIFVIGNKIDQNTARAITNENASQKFKTAGVNFIEVSAKSGENLQDLFTQACEQLLKSSNLQTTVSNIQIPRKKVVDTITGEKQRPIMKQKSKEIPKKQSKSEEKDEIRGSKLLKAPKNSGKYVKQKNCC